MKKIIEVKRGDPVPENANWLSVEHKEVTIEEKYGLVTHYRTVKVPYDVFEVQDQKTPEINGASLPLMGFR